MIRIALFVALLLGSLATALPASADQPQEITIKSFLYGAPEPSDPGNANLFAISGCFAVSGAITDQGGNPQFDSSGNIVSCGNPAAIDGHARFDGLGHLKSGAPNVLQATHRMFAQKGEIDIKFEGKYGPVVPVVTPSGLRFIATSGNGGGWQITCGTGAYAGLQGAGTSTAAADFTQAIAQTGPVTVVHTETGRAHVTGSSSC